MAGGSTSEEMDAFDDVTPDKPVSIYDLVEDLPTRTQSSDEIAQFQKLAREKREASFRSFRPPTEGAPTSARPIPRESGPVRIDRPAVPESEPAPASVARAPDPDLDAILSDVAAGLERLPAAPRVPKFEEVRASLETIHGADAHAHLAPVARPKRSLRAWVLGLALLVAIAALAYANLPR